MLNCMSRHSRIKINAHNVSGMGGQAVILTGGLMANYECMYVKREMLICFKIKLKIYLRRPNRNSEIKF